MRRHPDRRSFLKAGMAAAAAGILLPGHLGAAQAQGPDMAMTKGPDVAVAKGGPGPAARAAVELLGGMKAFVKPGDKVAIKPNMSFSATPDMASNTHPEVVQAVVAMCVEAGADSVRVLDNTLADAEDCLNLSGIRAACESIVPGSVQALSQDRFFREADVPGTSLKRSDVMRDVLDADVLIAVPKAKSHSGAGVSMSLKGMMGLVNNRRVFHWKHDLHTAIVDLNSLLKADLAVVDGTTALTTNGPWGPGEVVRGDIVIASADAVAADAVAVTSFPWYGRSIEPRQVRHLRLAAERGLGRIDVENLRIDRVSL